MPRRRPTPEARRVTAQPPGGLRAALGRPALCAGLVLIALVAFAAIASHGRPAAAAAPTPADGCRALPTFTLDPALGLRGTLALATDQRERGLVLLSSEGQRFQHPSWGDAGFLGAIAYDAGGNIYVAPTPRVSLADNPLAGVTTLWRADSATGRLRPFVTLPGAASERNPYGVLGLAYACGLDRLYAGGVAGSTPAAEHGGVVAVDLAGGAQTPVLAGLDVLGVLVVRAGSGYELYAGLARSPEVVALTLDERGDPVGTPRTLLDLTTAGAAPSERARKLRLVGDELVVDLVPFNYSLQSSASGAVQARRAAWAYDAAAGTWAVRRAAFEL